MSPEYQPVQIRESLRRFLGQFVPVRLLADADNIFSSGFVGSLFAMQLVLYVENTFGIAVEGVDLNIANFRSIDALCAFVSAKQGRAPRAGRP